MKIILLSGGPGKRMWPLSNDTRSKQFLKLLKAPDGSSESMLQRMVRQIKESEIAGADITIATSISQYDSITNQLGKSIDIVTEPKRRLTFPAIMLAATYLLKKKECSLDEVVVVMPSDSYVDMDYFKAIEQMVQVVETTGVDMALMGIAPTVASDRFGYIVPSSEIIGGEIVTANRFIEKPSKEVAGELIAQGAMWNAGVFAFKLSFIAGIVEQYIKVDSYEQMRERFVELKRISFDYEVVEKVNSIAVVPYSGEWADLGNWKTLSDKVDAQIVGNVTTDGNCNNTYIINELDTPIICLGADNMIVAASPDGILVSAKASSMGVKSHVDKLQARPMYEERRWGTYRVMGHEHFADGHNALTKLLYLNAGCNISYQYHNHREEIWTFVDGEGLLVLDDELIHVSRGYVAHIKAGEKHAVRAITPLQIIEVQTGTDLVEEDIIRLDLDWDKMRK